MKCFINGKYVEVAEEQLNEEEIKNIEVEQTELSMPTALERIEALENAILEIAEVLSNG